MSGQSDHTKIDVEIYTGKDGLSLKAKGAGLLILIAICLVGIILLGLKMAEIEKGHSLLLPIFILTYITYNLIATLDAVLGLSITYRDH